MFYQATFNYSGKIKEHLFYGIKGERFQQFNDFVGDAFNAQQLSSGFEQPYVSLVDTLTSTMSNNIANNIFGPSLSYNTPKWYINLDLMYANSRVQSNSLIASEKIVVNNTYQAFLPDLYLSFNRRKLTTFTLSLERQYGIPSGSDLLPVYNIFNIWNRSLGNPNLGQTVFNNGWFSFRSDLKKGPFKSIRFYQSIRQSNSFKVSDSRIDENGLLISSPVLLKGYFSNNTNLDFVIKLYKNKYFLNYGTGFNLVNSPNVFNGQTVMNTNQVYSNSLGFNISISDSLEFNVSYALNNTKNTNNVNNRLDFEQWIQSVNSDLRAVLRFGTSINVNLGVEDQRAVPGIGKIVPILNLYVQQPLDKNQKWNLKVSAFDVFKQNVGISRIANEGFVTIAQSNRLQQFFMVTLVYKVKNMGGTSDKYVY